MLWFVDNFGFRQGFPFKIIYPNSTRDSDPSERVFGTQRAGTRDSTNTANRTRIHKFVHS